MFFLLLSVHSKIDFALNLVEIQTMHIVKLLCLVSQKPYTNSNIFFSYFQSTAEERDRGEDAISFASRRSLAKVPQPGGTVPRHAINSASMRSKRSLQSTTSKKYPPEGGYLGGHHTTYSLWSAQNSLKREHKRKFNRSLCGVLLGISIVLVILGILGIIGIAVYLGGEFFL